MADNFTLPRAAWKVTLDGRDLTELINPRLLSASISEKRSDEADRLDITLHDADGLMEIPRPGALLHVQMGWIRGTGLPLGLVDKGTFRVDQASWRGDPDQITIRARSADFTDAFRIRRERSFVGCTVAEILGAIAQDNGLKLAIDALLGSLIIPALGPGAKSDAALLRALGRRFDAVATVKAGALLFTPIGNGLSASGQSLPVEVIDRSAMNRPEYERIERENYGGVIAVWHDRATAERREIQIGGDGEGKPKRLRKIFANAEDARQAAQAEDRRIGRAKAKLRFELPLGRPDLFPDRPLSISGLKDEVSALNWLINEITHTMDGKSGLATSISLEYGNAEN
ncbi:phage late control D family protein [Altericroceibacterium endophyticum]|uniref:Phage late control D family protein n=1 Tax=Altericroceibacterium endophyticum TaxID=1808508 RepID=A0A6I4T5U2_9SPHN|nr:phage late control D family protein [Altericroceibacterium endophyticum]MXO66266.1 phage late control D family protein [Altericroceibacterium endophyticum]